MPILDETIQPLVGDIENDEANTASTGTFVERPHFALSQVTQCYSFSAKLSRSAMVDKFVYDSWTTRPETNMT